MFLTLLPGKKEKFNYFQQNVCKFPHNVFEKCKAKTLNEIKNISWTHFLKY
jgi:hypothetical protein